MQTRYKTPEKYRIGGSKQPFFSGFYFLLTKCKRPHPLWVGCGCLFRLPVYDKCIYSIM